MRAAVKRPMRPIKTGSWFAKVPPDHIKIGISRGNPRGQSGYRLYRALAPGPWFHSVDAGEYVKRYSAILKALDPRKVLDDIERLADGRTPVLCCFEPTEGLVSGTCWCHRSLAAYWLHKTTGVAVEEYGAPGFDPLMIPAFRNLRSAVAGHISP